MLGKLLKATTINKIQNQISLLLLGSAAVVSLQSLINKLEVNLFIVSNIYHSYKLKQKKLKMKMWFQKMLWL